MTEAYPPPVYAVIRSGVYGVYDHGIFGIYTSEEAAMAGMARAKLQEPDDHHEMRVSRYVLNMDASVNRYHGYHSPVYSEDTIWGPGNPLAKGDERQ